MPTLISASTRHDTTRHDTQRTFVLKVEERRQVATFVVAAQHEERLRVIDLEREQEQHALAREAPAIDVVAEEEVLRVPRVAARLEQAEQVEVLAVDVAAHYRYAKTS